MLTSLTEQSRPAWLADAVERFLAVAVLASAQSLTFLARFACPAQAAPDRVKKSH